MRIGEKTRSGWGGRGLGGLVEGPPPLAKRERERETARRAVITLIGSYVLGGVWALGAVDK